MEDKFIKLNLNGVEKYVSAVYDGSGNDIISTYETKTDATSKEIALSGHITTVSETLAALTERVTTTEGFATEIESNKTNIQTNLESINSLKDADEAFQNSLDTLTIKVGENTSTITEIRGNVETLSNSLLSLNTKVGTLEAIVNDEASGINALNTQADKNTADIADLLARIVALEEVITTQAPGA